MTGTALVKVCGVTREDEVDGLAQLGVDFFGLVVGHNVAYAVTEERAAALVGHARNRLLATIVTTGTDVDSLSRLIERTQAPAIQLAGFMSARRLARLRERFSRARLTILQVIHFQGGRAAEQGAIAKYENAGVDLFILDSVGQSGALGSTGTAIDAAVLQQYREQTECKVPVLVAGGVDASNVAALMLASRANGIDVSTSVRSETGVELARVGALIEAMP